VTAVECFKIVFNDSRGGGRGRRWQWARRPLKVTQCLRRIYIFFKRDVIRNNKITIYRPAYLQRTRCVQWPWVVKTLLYRRVNTILTGLPFGLHHLLLFLYLSFFLLVERFIAKKVCTAFYYAEQPVHFTSYPHTGNTHIGITPTIQSILYIQPPS